MPPHYESCRAKAMVPSQSATIARHLPVPSLATICAARTRFCSRLECPMPTGYHQGSGRQHLGASLACQFHSRPKLSPGKETSCRPPELGKLRCPPQPISPPVPCSQPALRSQQPRSAVNRLLDYPRPTSSKGCWDSLQRMVPVLMAMDHIL